MLTNLPSWIHTAIVLINFYKHIIYASLQILQIS